MDADPNIVEPQVPETPQSANKLSQFVNFLKNLSLPKKIALISIILLLLASALFLIFRSSKNNGTTNNSNTSTSKSNLPKNLIARVGEKDLYKSYLDHELSYQPTSPTPELKKILTEKIINDQITLDYGVEQAIIDDKYNSENQTKEQYLERTNAVQKVKNELTKNSSKVSGKIVSVWFYNNRYIGPLGIEKGKELAYSKIKPLYDKVKNKTMTIDQAGKQLEADKSLATLDPSYEVNAFAEFTYNKGQDRLTFWPEFNTMLRTTPVGQLTPLYLGQDRDEKGAPIDQLYIFAQIDQIVSDKEYGSYEEWLQLQKQNQQIEIGDLSFSISYPGFFAFINSLLTVNAQENGGGHGGVPEVWQGVVRTPTGAPLAGAEIKLTSTCSPGGRTTTTDGSGYYSFGQDPNYSCGCNPNVLTASYNGQVCASATKMIENIFTQVAAQDFVCVPPPPPTPPPPVNRCGQSCSNRSDCDNARDECSFCLPNQGGAPGFSCQKQPKCGDECTTDLSCADALNNCTKCLPDPANNNRKICQPPPPPPQCGTPCTNDQNCNNALNGCNVCMPNPNAPAGSICSKPPQCGNPCTGNENCVNALNGCNLCLPDPNSPTGSVCSTNPQCGTACVDSKGCVDAKDGCTNCIKDGATAKCGTCPAGMNYDPTQMKCVCPNPGETNPHGVCNGEKCTQVNSCGVTSCTNDKQCFAEDMCKCDGFEAAQLEYPSAKPFTFNAYAKIEGTDIAKAMVEGIRFKLSESDKSNPNAGTIVAQSPMYTPELVSSTANKARFKATWNLTPPQIKANKVYRVFSEIKCAPKKKATANAKDPNQFQSKVAGVSTVNAQEPSPIPDELQLKTLNFIKKGQTDNCRFLFFEYNQGL